jgi:hypothetical protein
MLKKIVLIFLLLNSFAALGSDEKNILQDAKTIKRYEDAGICFGSYEGAIAKGVAVSSLSEIARNNLIKIIKDYAIVDKYKDSRKKCHVDGKSLPDIRACIENSIPNKSGILLTGTINIATQKLKQGIPYTSKPEGMAYYTKYSPAGIDTAFTIVALTKWNGTSRDTIGFATDIITSNIISWSKRIVPIIYDANLTAAPDTLIILFSSSSRVAPKLGSTFILDEINLYPTGTSNIIETASDNLVVYPNPVSSVLNLKNIDSNISNIKIFDVSGKKVFENKISTFTSTLNLSALSNGLYYMIGSDANNNAISKTKFEVSK